MWREWLTFLIGFTACVAAGVASVTPVRAEVLVSTGGYQVVADSPYCVEVGDRLVQYFDRANAGDTFALSSCLVASGGYQPSSGEVSGGDLVVLNQFRAGAYIGQQSVYLMSVSEVSTGLSRRVSSYPVGEVVVYVGCLLLFALGLLIGS